MPAARRGVAWLLRRWSWCYGHAMGVIHRAAPLVYVLGVLIAVFTASANVAGAVAVIGGVVLALMYLLAKPRGRRHRSRHQSDPG